MSDEANLSQNTQTALVKSRYDAVCKRILSEKRILAWILQSCVEEFRNTDVEEIAELYIEGSPQVSEIPVAPDEKPPSRIIGSNTEDSSVLEGTVYYDIRFVASAPGSDCLIRLLLNIEAQNDFYTGYPLIKRGIYYGSRMISSQYETEFTKSHYEDIRKVYSLWIFTNPPAERHNGITSYRITEEQQIGAVSEAKKNYDLMTVVMIYIGKPGEENFGGVLKLLYVLFTDEIGAREKEKILQDEFGIPVTQTLDEEVRQMCNLSDGVWKKGMEAGMEAGILKSIRSLMSSLELSSDQAMTALQIPESEQPRYTELLNT